MTLANTADRGIARHLTGVFGAKGQQADPCPAAGSCSCRLAPGMAAFGVVMFVVLILLFFKRLSVFTWMRPRR